MRYVHECVTVIAGEHYRTEIRGQPQEFVELPGQWRYLKRFGLIQIAVKQIVSIGAHVSDWDAKMLGSERRIVTFVIWNKAIVDNRERVNALVLMARDCGETRRVETAAHRDRDAIGGHAFSNCLRQQLGKTFDTRTCISKAHFG